MGNTTKIFTFNKVLHDVISNSKLDIGTTYFILKNIFREIETLYYAQLNKELINEESSNK